VQRILNITIGADSLSTPPFSLSLSLSLFLRRYYPFARDIFIHRERRQGKNCMAMGSMARLLLHVDANAPGKGSGKRVSGNCGTCCVPGRNVLLQWITRLATSSAPSLMLRACRVQDRAVIKLTSRGNARYSRSGGQDRSISRGTSRSVSILLYYSFTPRIYSPPLSLSLSLCLVGARAP